MIDICMCSWKECPIESTCFRSTKLLPVDVLQSYADFKDDYDEETKSCKSRIPIDFKVKRRKEF